MAWRKPNFSRSDSLRTSSWATPAMTTRRNSLSLSRVLMLSFWNYRSKRKVFLDESEWVMYPDPSIPAIVPEELWDRAKTVTTASTMACLSWASWSKMPAIIWSNSVV